MKHLSILITIVILLLVAVGCGKNDTTPPSITDISAQDISGTTATITWITDEPATSSVEFGEPADYGSSTPLDENLLIAHSVSLSGLEPDTTYHYRVRSQDSSNNEAVSGDYTFTTASSVSGQLAVHFINVGQGDAILVDYGTYEMLIDGGRWGDCAAYISSYIDSALEVMVATHPDADHIGGLGDVLDAFEVAHIWLNGDTATTQTYTGFMDKVNMEGAQVHQAQRGDQIGLSTLTFDVLHPTLPLGSDRNENSMVLELSFGQVDFLFTGDAESGAEASMVAAGLIDDIDILKVSHHGSKYCSTVSFLTAAQPEIAIYSAGANNPYGHPAPETITRLDDTGATIYGTDVHGTIIVTSNGTTYDVYLTSDVPPVVPAGTDDTTPSVLSDLQIICIFYDGFVYRLESDEYVEIKNLGDTPQDLKGWVLKDISEGYPSFMFPSYILAPGESIRVYTNEIHPEWGGFSFGYGKAIWNNTDPDVAALYNAQGQEVSRKSY